MSDIYLLTTTAPDFFAGLGFRRAGRKTAPPAIRATRQFATLCPASAVLMHLNLSEDKP
jgi:amino-acid N-acetyltransferase